MGIRENFRGICGKGHLKYLTLEEEKHIKTRLLNSSNNGRDLTMDFLKKIVTEEFEIVMVNYPERKKLEELRQNARCFTSFIYNFSKRNHLHELCDKEQRQDREKRRSFVCNICQYAFTF